LTAKCLLVCENDVMTAGVKFLLAEQTDLEVHVIEASIEKEIAQAVNRLHPVTVIVDAEVRKTLPAELWKMLMNVPDLQVIIFNQINNMLLIHQNAWSGQALVQDMGTVVRSFGSHSRLS
jgi:DNA-binding NarL/FixJ family response regulator